jgi:hypothetical protein
LVQILVPDFCVSGFFPLAEGESILKNLGMTIQPQARNNDGCVEFNGLIRSTLRAHIRVLNGARTAINPHSLNRTHFGNDSIFQKCNLQSKVPRLFAKTRDFHIYAPRATILLSHPTRLWHGEDQGGKRQVGRQALR